MEDKERNTKIISIIMLVGILYILWGNVKYKETINQMELQLQDTEQKYIDIQHKIDSIKTKL